MPDLFEKFKEWIELKGTMHVSRKLGHQGTTRFVERWIKDGKVPFNIQARLLYVMQQEGIIK